MEKVREVKCTSDFVAQANDGTTLQLEAGKTYVVSPGDKGNVKVHSPTWAYVPDILFEEKE